MPIVALLLPVFTGTRMPSVRSRNMRFQSGPLMDRDTALQRSPEGDRFCFKRKRSCVDVTLSSVRSVTPCCFVFLKAERCRPVSFGT